MAQQAQLVDLIRISQAENGDVEAIKQLADQHRHELGFIVRAVLLDAAGNGRIYVATQRNRTELVGFIHFRHRKDGKTKIYQLCIHPAFRRIGVGRALLENVAGNARRSGQRSLVLSCPEGLPANSFYRHVGFRLDTVLKGRGRVLYTWSQIILDSKFSTRLV